MGSEMCIRDSYKIDIEDAIQFLPRQFILDQCFEDGNAELCNLITRRAVETSSNSAGSIEFIDTQNFNTGGTEVEGIDVVASYTKDLDFLGSFSGVLDARLSYSYLIDGFVIPVTGADADPFAGELGTSEHRFTSNLAIRSTT